VADPSPTAELCPRCASRPIDETNTETGWCTQCSDTVVVEHYIDREHAAADARNAKWKARSASDQPDATRERQRASRLARAVQPRERPEDSADPWEICFRGLQHLKRVEVSMGSNAGGREHLEAACECLRQLAVGPED
jgi:hypothetical protein